MPGEQPPLKVNMGEPSIDDAINSFRNRRTEQQAADAAANEAAREHELASLPPEVAAKKRRLQNEISQMASEKRSPTYYPPNYRSSPLDSVFFRRAAAAAVSAGSATLALGIWYGATQATESAYGPSQAQSYLEQQGYTHVTNGGTNTLLVGWRGCSSDDMVQYNFEATSINGVQVHMMVCKGLFKAATIRQG